MKTEKMTPIDLRVILPESKTIQEAYSKGEGAVVSLFIDQAQLFLEYISKMDNFILTLEKRVRFLEDKAEIKNEK